MANIQKKNGYLVGTLDIDEAKKKIADFLNSLPTLSSIIENYVNGYADDGEGNINSNYQVYEIEGDPRKTSEELIKFLESTNPTYAGNGRVCAPVPSRAFTYLIARNEIKSGKNERYIELFKYVEVEPGYENSETGTVEKTRLIMIDVLGFKGW